jgi:hypothetical protein
MNNLATIIFVIPLAIANYIHPPTVRAQPDEIFIRPISQPMAAVEPLKQVEAKPLAQLAPVVVEQPQAPKTQATGTCAEWIAAAGITEVAVANELIRRESGCNPYARNQSSGACGVAQELPCGKSGCSLGDGACQVRWMNSYVKGRYGSWSAAVAHHNSHNWY